MPTGISGRSVPTHGQAAHVDDGLATGLRRCLCSSHRLLVTLIDFLIISATGSIACWQIALRAPQMLRQLPALLPLMLFSWLIAQVESISGGATLIADLEWVPSLGVALGFRLDGFSLLFGLMITGIGTLVTIYATSYFADASPAKRARFTLLIHLFMTAMLGTVLSDNLIVMFVFWETTSLTSFLLIGFEFAKPEARRAALQSLLITCGGGLALFGGIVLIGIQLGTFSFSEVVLRADELVASPYLAAVVMLVMLGAFTKSAQFPFHFWLPQAMAAPTPASAYLHSATMVKLGIYLLARFENVFVDVPAYGVTLVLVGMTTMLVAAFNAIRATGYKAVLAQSTVASLGILVMLIGLDGPVSSVALIGFILTHALYKAALFFCAGTAIHATHIAELRKLGGLARHLPITAAAAVLASLSMAGLPPFVGFIAKEYLFEAQLESSWSMVPVIVAVIVNGVMVAVAGAVSLRPFFQGQGKISHVHHGETPGLLAGPLALAALGIVFGLVPSLIAKTIVAPAASALRGTPIDVSFSLWHGLTPMLGLSAAVIALGLVLIWKWDAFHHAIGKSRITHKLDADRIYHRAVAGILDLARVATRWLQNGDQRHYSLIVVITLLGVGAYAVLVGGGVELAWTGGTVLPFPSAVLLLALLGALVALRTSSLVTALVGIGIVGYGSALLFLINGAPDLALTQFAVETLVLVVLMAVLVRLPTQAPRTRTTRERTVDAVLAVAFSMLVFLGLGTMLSGAFDTRLSDFYGATSYLEALGHNVVNVIIVDYRGFDTVGEIAVVGFATLAVWALLRRRTGREG